MADVAVSGSLILIEEVLFFLKKLKLTSFNEEVEDLKLDLNRMLAYLREMESRDVRCAVLEVRVKEVREVAYEIEDVLDEFMLHMLNQFHPHTIVRGACKLAHFFTHWRQRSHISSKMDSIKQGMKKIVERDSVTHGGNGNGNGITTLEEGSSSTGHDLDDDEIVGFENPLKELGQQLVHGESRRVTISVVASGGSGKTVLVQNVYKSRKVQRRFDCHAWVHVTRSFDVEKLLKNMLEQFCPSRKDPNNPQYHEGTDIRGELRKHLQRKRYVVVLDDIWSKEPWETIRNALPNDSRGSRIIVTTRNSDVASSCVESPHCILLKLPELPWPEAWELFSRKAFRNSNGKCPPELKDCAEKILKICEGLPLAIVAVGGLLSRKPQHLAEWQKLHDSIGSEIGSNRNLSVISKILLPSYNDLTGDLKKCFLYFSNFPSDYAVKHGRLIRLWVAEQFAEDADGGKTAEDVAKEYLNELVQRNLVHVIRCDFDGQVKSCRVQKLVLEFIVQKSKEENFVMVVAEKRKNHGERVRRLSIHNECPTFSGSKQFSRIRSFFLSNWDNRLSPSIRGNVLSEFKLLRVLDLQGTALAKFPEGIVLLTLLRYLSLRNTEIESVPKSIKKLTFLETLDLRQTKVTELPAKIFHLVRLRHLLVYRYNVAPIVEFDCVTGVKVLARIGALTDLQKLSAVEVDNHGKMIKEFGGLTQLRKLGLQGLKREHGVNLCTSIQKLQNLTTLDVCSTSKDERLHLEDMLRHPPHLQRLYLKGRLDKVPGWVPSLDNLFKISLMWSRLECSPLEALQELPNLIELHMLDAYCRPELVFEAGTFKKLKVLFIGQFDELCGVVIHKGATPELRKLSLSNCEKLKILPRGIKKLTRLEQLLVYQMPKEFNAHLDKDHKDRKMVNHIPVIRSFSHPSF